MQKVTKRVINVLSIGVMTVGVLFSVHALTKKDEVRGAKKEKVVKVLAQAVWYEVQKIDPTGSDNPSNYEIIRTISAPATGTNPTNCAQANSSGQYCAFQLTFDNSEDPESALNKDVATAMSDLTASQTGQARNPSHP